MADRAAPPVRTHNTAARVAAAWLLGLIALALAGWAGDELVTTYGIAPQWRLTFQAVLMSGLVVPGVWLLRRHLDRRPVAGLAILDLAPAIRGFALGSGVILVPTVITLLCTALFGWATLSVDPSPGAGTTIIVAILTAFFFEALPEELLFRGYIFRNLNAVMRAWTAGVLTTVLFALLPVVVVQVQQHLLAMDVRIGNADHVTFGYVATLLVFGGILQYLRILTGTVWTCVAFHLLFLLSDRIAGLRAPAFIRMSDVTAPGLMQVTLVGSVLLIVTALLFRPRLAGRALDWRSVHPE